MTVKVGEGLSWGIGYLPQEIRVLTDSNALYREEVSGGAFMLFPPETILEFRPSNPTAEAATELCCAMEETLQEIKNQEKSERQMGSQGKPLRRLV